jgi:hypothetical protein
MEEPDNRELTMRNTTAASPKFRNLCGAIWRAQLPIFTTAASSVLARSSRSFLKTQNLPGRDCSANRPPEFQNTSLSAADLSSLVAFLQFLTEDYDA